MPVPAPSPRVRAAAALLLTATAVGAGEADDPTAFLEFESVLDGRCQNLSEGGKLRVLHNRHATGAIEFRLLRMFAGKPQGLVTGVAVPGGEPIRLGCTRVDGRDQDWVVERARFRSEEE